MISLRKLYSAGLLAGALLLPCTIWGQIPRGRPNTPSPFAGGVTAQGRIVPVGGVIRVAAPMSATGQAIVDTLLVKEGDTVEAGQLLAYLRGRALMQAQVDSATKDKAAATAALVQAQAGQARALAELQAQLADLEGRADVAEAAEHRAAAASRLAVEEAQSGEAAARTALDNAKHLQETAQASTAAAVALAQAQLDVIPKSRTIERTLATAQVVQAKADKARADTEMANQIAQLQATADLAAIHTSQAEAALISYPPADPSSLSPEQAQAVAARASIAAQQKLIEATTTEGTADIAAAQAHIEAADAARVAAQAQMALSEVRAPSAGEVLTIVTHPGEAVGPAGLLQLGDTREIYIDALVYIDDVPNVHVGQKTMTTGSALPDDGLTGQVVSISPTVAGNTLPNPDPTVFSDQPVVLVKVRLDNPAPAANLINGQVKVQFAP